MIIDSFVILDSNDISPKVLNTPPTAVHHFIIVLRISNAIVRAKKGEDRIGGYILAKVTEMQRDGRLQLPIRPSVLPEYLDGR